MLYRDTTESSRLPITSAFRILSSPQGSWVPHLPAPSLSLNPATEELRVFTKYLESKEPIGSCTPVVTEETQEGGWGESTHARSI